MNKKFILITHGNFASGIKNTLEMIIGKQENLVAVDCYIEKDFDIEKIVKDLLKKYSEYEIVFLTDIFGGSVNNYIMSILNEKIYAVTGISLPFLINLFEYQDLKSNDMIFKAITESKKELKKCEINKIIKDEEF